MKKISLIFILSASLFAGNTLAVSTATDDGAGMVSFGLTYDFMDDVAGFQFDVLSDGAFTLTGAAGGAAEAAGFSMSTNEAGTVIGFSFTGGTIAAGAGDFITLSGTYDSANAGTSVVIEAKEDCTSDGTPDCNGDTDTRLVFSDSAGDPLEADFHEAAWTLGESTVTLGNEPVKVYAYDLSDNYPNPFNPSTQINYGVEFSGDVSIVVYDMMGREVKTLVSEHATPGIYSVVWDARNNQGLDVSAGIYIYKMISGDFVKVNKMMLVK